MQINDKFLRALHGQVARLVTRAARVDGPSKKHLLGNNPAHVLAADAPTDLAPLAEVDRFRYCKCPHKSARADSCNDAASGSKIQFLAFHSPSRRN